MDLEINQYVENLPEGAITLANAQYLMNALCMMHNVNPIILNVKEGTNSYYSKFKQFQDSFNAMDSNGDVHNTWEEFEGLEEAKKKLVENQLDYLLKDVGETIMKSRGTIPGEMKVKIDELLKPNPQVFNWKSYFRRLMGNSIFVYTKKSLRKLSKRFEDSAGIKIKQKVNILVAIDTDR